MPVTCTNYKLKCGGCPLLNQPYPDQLLLVLELVGVGLVQQRAAAAFQFIIGAGYRHGV